MSLQIFHDFFFCLRRNVAVCINAIQQILRSKVTGHNNDRVLEIYGTSL